MQKVRYCLSFNSLYIKFQVLLHQSLKGEWIHFIFSPFVHTTIHYRY